MDEATALLTTLEATRPEAPTACTGWTAHDLTAHLAAGAKEMADLVEVALAGQPDRPTRPFTTREAPFVAMPDAVLREHLIVEALRLNAATETLAQTGSDTTVAFAGRRLTAAELDLHGRSEAALHRWDLVGDDETSRALLAQPELTTHAATVLNEMLPDAGEAPIRRARRAGVSATRAVLRSPDRPDVILLVDNGRARFEIAEQHDDPPTLVTDPATRLLLLWGRRSAEATVTWCQGQGARRPIEALLWPVPTRP
ncbi:MAG TPA: maleylpyruvate isomerase N-terminal domain-containing protein [Acidimicrobiia bacterium]|nr:maleylpyruvate isomerase N-terminal domain-containing protein [Acidimicrobiia bacterium]